MGNKLFIVDTYFTNFHHRNNTFDWTFGEKEEQEVLNLYLTSSKIAEDINKGKFLVISDLCLSAMSAADIVKSTMEIHLDCKSATEEVVFADSFIPPSRTSNKNFISWSELIQEKDEQKLKEKRNELYQKWKDALCNITESSDANIVFFPDPEHIRSFLVFMGVPSLTLFALMGGSGGGHTFVFDHEGAHAEILDLTSFTQNESLFKKECERCFGSYNQNFLLKIMTMDIQLKIKLIYLNEKGYDTTLLEEKYEEFFKKQEA